MREKEIHEWLFSPEAQFKQHKRIAIPGGIVKFREVRPDWERTSPVVLAPGWGTVPETYQEFVLDLAREGWRSLVFESFQGTGAGKRKENALEAEHRKAAALVELLEHENITSAHGVGHSAGNLKLLMAANGSDRFRDVVLMNPAGMLKKESARRIIESYTRESFKQAVRSLHDPVLRKEILRTFPMGKRKVVREARRSTQEVQAMAAVNLRGMVSEFREHGGKVALLVSSGDLIFPPEKILEGLNADEFFDAASSFKKKDAGHGAPVLDAPLFAKAVSQQLEQLERMPNVTSNDQDTI